MDAAPKKVMEDAENHIRNMFYGYPLRIKPTKNYKFKEEKEVTNTDKTQEK